MSCEEIRGACGSRIGKSSSAESSFKSPSKEMFILNPCASLPKHPDHCGVFIAHYCHLKHSLVLALDPQQHLPVMVATQFSRTEFPYSLYE